MHNYHDYIKRKNSNIKNLVKYIGAYDNIDITETDSNSIPVYYCEHNMNTEHDKLSDATSICEGNESFTERLTFPARTISTIQLTNNSNSSKLSTK